MKSIQENGKKLQEKSGKFVSPEKILEKSGNFVSPEQWEPCELVSVFTHEDFDVLKK